MQNQRHEEHYLKAEDGTLLEVKEGVIVDADAADKGGPYFQAAENYTQKASAPNPHLRIYRFPFFLAPLIPVAFFVILALGGTLVLAVLALVLAVTFLKKLLF